MISFFRSILYILFVFFCLIIAAPSYAVEIQTNEIPEDINKQIDYMIEDEFIKKQKGDISFGEKYYVESACKKEKIMIMVWGRNGYSEFLKYLKGYSK